jgi:hypothetical protein
VAAEEARPTGDKDRRCRQLKCPAIGGSGMRVFSTAELAVYTSANS